MAKVNCPKCATLFPVGDDERGVEVRCPKCQALLRLRGKPSAATKPQPPARSSIPDRLAGPKPPPDEDERVENVPVVRKRRRVKRRRREEESAGLPEWFIPLGIFVFAGVMNALIALRGGTEEGRARLIFSLISLVVTVPSTIVGLFVAAAAMGANFGNVFSAAIKIAAMNTVVQCIYTFGMLGSGDGSSMLLVLIALPVYWGMFMWFFDLTFTETIWATIFIGLVQRVVNTVLMLLLTGVLMKAAEGGL
jgi:predicted Zn finger-like uncharacterized protein